MEQRLLTELRCGVDDVVVPLRWLSLAHVRTALCSSRASRLCVTVESSDDDWEWLLRTFDPPRCVALQHLEIEISCPEAEAMSAALLRHLPCVALTLTIRRGAGVVGSLAPWSLALRANTPATLRLHGDASLLGVLPPEMHDCRLDLVGGAALSAVNGLIDCAKFDVRKIGLTDGSYSSPALPEFLRQCPRLETLYVMWPSGGARLFHSLEGLKNLTYLELVFSDPPTEIEADAMCNYLSVSSLATLVLYYWCGDKVVQCLESMKALSTLKLLCLSLQDSASFASFLRNASHVSAIGLWCVSFRDKPTDYAPLARAIPSALRSLQLCDCFGLFVGCPGEVANILKRMPVLRELEIEARFTVEMVAQMAAVAASQLRVLTIRTGFGTANEAKASLLDWVKGLGLLDFVSIRNLFEENDDEDLATFCGAVNHRNACMHGRARLAALSLVAIRRFRQSSLSPLPKEIVRHIGQFVWWSRGDVATWWHENE